MEQLQRGASAFLRHAYSEAIAAYTESIECGQLGVSELVVAFCNRSARWASFDPEMRAAWADLAAAVAAEGLGGAARGAPPPQIPNSVLDAVLRVAFFWYNFMPLTRGSAAVGWTMVMALALAAGYEVSEGQPPNLSLDWEAILTTSLAGFTAATRPWLRAACRPSGRGAAVDLDALPRVAHVFGTARTVLEALIAAEPK